MRPSMEANMAFSVNSPVGDGVTTQFAVSFTNGLYSRDNVHVFVGDETTERAFTWINDGLIDVQGTVPAVGEVVTIRRIMDKTNKAVDFADGEILDERNLDTMVDQLYNISHEFLDGYGLTEVNVDIDMRGNSLTNVGGGDPNDPGSLATIGDLQNAIVSPEDLVDAVRISNNFSDLDDTTVCRTNLEVYSKAEVQEVTQANANILINGDFQVWQRGSNATQLDGDYLADRWWGGQNVDAARFDNEAYLAASASYGISVYDTTSPSLNLELGQPIELPTAGKAGEFEIGNTFTFSASIWADVSGDVKIFGAFRDSHNNSSNQVDAIGSIPTVSLVGGTVNDVEVTFTINATPNSTNTMLDFGMYRDSAISNYVVSNAKLERGSVATPFEYEPYGDVLLKCQRYYEKSSTYFSYPLLRNTAASTSSDDCTGTRFMVQKRADPSLKIFSRLGTEGWVSRFNGNIDDAEVLTTTAATDGITSVNFDRSLDVDVAFIWEADAEL